MVERVSRMSPAAPPRAKVRVGMMKHCQESMPLEGSHPSFTEKNSINNMARKKPGIAESANAMTVVKLSTKEYCLTALSTPKGMPIMALSAIENTAMRIVLGKRANSSSVTGFWVLYEVPKSRRIMPER